MTLDGGNDDFSKCVSMKDAGIFDNIDKNLLDKFKAYHEKNPEIYKRFVIYAKQLRNFRGKSSAWLIMNRIRWDFETSVKGDEKFKVNNDYISLYARLTIYNHPEFKDFFEIRRMKPSDRRSSSEEIYRRQEGNTL